MDTHVITARPSFEALEPRLLLSTGPILGADNQPPAVDAG